jgi:hypothetical protein
MAKRKAPAPARTPATSKKTASSRRAKKKASGRGTSRGARPHAPIRAAGARRTAAKKKKKTKAKQANNKTARLKARPAAAKKKAAKRRTVAPSKPRQSAKRPSVKAPRLVNTAARRFAPVKAARLDRVRRILDETIPTLEEMVPTPPSSLDMDRHASAARTGRLEIAETRRNLGSLGSLTGGDVDADAENAYFSGDEAPGGDNPTPDQDIVEDIGRALGVQYQDNEELRGSDKVIERDRHRWELDPASSEDYKERK